MLKPNSVIARPSAAGGGEAISASAQRLLADYRIVVPEIATPACCNALRRASTSSLQGEPSLRGDLSGTRMNPIVGKGNRDSSQ